jgi:GTPase
VEDDGTPSGLTADELDQSIQTLERIAKELSADATGLFVRGCFYLFFFFLVSKDLKELNITINITNKQKQY